MDISKVVGGGKRTDWMSRSSSKLAWKLSYRRGRSLSRWPVGMFFRFLPKFDPAKLLTSVRRWTGDIVKLRTPFYFDFFKEKRITVWCYLPTHRIFELLKRLKWLLVKVFCGFESVDQSPPAPWVRSWWRSSSARWRGEAGRSGREWTSWPARTWGTTGQLSNSCRQKTPSKSPLICQKMDPSLMPWWEWKKCLFYSDNKQDFFVDVTTCYVDGVKIMFKYRATFNGFRYGRTFWDCVLTIRF